MDDGPRFRECEDIALEAERLHYAGYGKAAKMLLDQIRNTCLFEECPCPMSSG